MVHCARFVFQINEPKNSRTGVWISNTSRELVLGQVTSVHDPGQGINEEAAQWVSLVAIIYENLTTSLSQYTKIAFEIRHVLS